LEPEILVVDEVLAVGDAEFQKKCLGKMSDVAQQGRTVLFVSHNMSAVLRLTQETLVIDHVYGIHPTANLWLLPLLILLALITAIGVSLWLSALNVMYRDVGHMLPFLNQFWMYITPIAYSSSIVPEKWRFVYALNPLTGVVEGFRWALLGTGEGPGITLLISSCIAILITISGLFYFRRMERKFADLV